MTELRRVRVDALVPLSESLATHGRLPAGWVSYTEPVGVACDVELVRQLTDRAAAMLSPDRMDPWLAPRLHAALRISRRTAADEGMWAWLAFQCHRFVEARFRKGGAKLHPWRYRGAWSRNAVSRLWWGAEMTRNGADYSSVELCFARTRTAQFALELMYSWDRAAAIAFVRVAEGRDGGQRLTDSQTRGLSTKLKVYLALRSLDAFGDGEAEDTEEFDVAWAKHEPAFAALTVADVRKIQGPASGAVPNARIAEIASWYRTIVAAEPLDVDTGADEDEGDARAREAEGSLSA